MKQTATIALLVLLILVSSLARAAQQDNHGKENNSQPVGLSKKTITIYGIVGSEGKTLVSDTDSRIWKVVNPGVLRASEGRRVTIKAYIDAGSSEIKVAVVKLRGERTAAKLDDAAFRR